VNPPKGKRLTEAGTSIGTPVQRYRSAAELYDALALIG